MSYVMTFLYTQEAKRQSFLKNTFKQWIKIDIQQNNVKISFPRSGNRAIHIFRNIAEDYRNNVNVVTTICHYICMSNINCEIVAVTDKQ